MLPIKKILCPVDFSTPCYKALARARELAAHFSSTLTLLHVVSPIPVIPNSTFPSAAHVPDLLSEMEESASRSLAELEEDFAGKGINCKTIVVHGAPADQIVATASAENSELIVIATHGMTGWKRVLFGSVAEKVVRYSPCAVLTIRAPETDEKESSE
ncbi:MAG TPA: universal stress protein [Desulfobacteraceae bacterium]|jgi:nucleotide-binding universal stress UspA family protein|nr:universal stress protein [Desulfobacteraceae bacterium]